jgi:hypothetical protein
LKARIGSKRKTIEPKGDRRTERATSRAFEHEVTGLRLDLAYDRGDRVDGVDGESPRLKTIAGSRHQPEAITELIETKLSVAPRAYDRSDDVDMVAQ